MRSSHLLLAVATTFQAYESHKMLSAPIISAWLSTGKL